MMKVKSKDGSDIVSGITKFSKKLGLPEPKNFHLPGHKFTGPFTEFEKRVYENGHWLPEFTPYNQIDEIAFYHDKCYGEADKGQTTRKQCDKEMLDRLDKVKTKGIREKIDYALVKPIIWIKHKLGLGIDPDKQLAIELHKPIRLKFKRRTVLVYNINNIWAADLMDKQKFSRYNKGYKYILNIIDTFSKYAYSIPLKNK